MQRIYLDNNATTPVSPKVLEVMLSELSGPAANPSSAHYYGQKARQKLLGARETVAHHFRFHPQEVLFTSSGTEAMNTLIEAAALTSKGQIITSTIEHSCVHLKLAQLASQGWEVIALSPGEKGYLAAEEIQENLSEKTRFIVLSAVNNETGIKSPVDAIGSLALEKGIPFLVDGVAWLGKEEISLHPGITAVGFSAHKIHGPKGTGFALCRSSFPVTPLLIGGPQENGRRAGTENLAGILGAATAVEECHAVLSDATSRMKKLCTQLEEGLVKHCDAILNGTGERICNTLNMSFPHFDGETLLILLDQKGIAVSHGSACSAGALGPSRVLREMGLPKERVRSSLRFSLSRYTTLEEIATCLEAFQTLPCYK